MTGENGKQESSVSLKAKTKGDDVTETATEGDDGEVPDDYYDRCENTDAEISRPNSKGNYNLIFNVVADKKLIK